ncbi:hypothetical protein FRC03_010225 [Tulasnella sp. 419]|nr:hypothetical protein FRC03_010225 [Tulasnella sp. 419]
MIESTPGRPYSGSISDLLTVESNMAYRRELMKAHLKDSEYPMTITSFPRLGAPGVFSDPHHDPAKSVTTRSLFLPEEVINNHCRFRALTNNIQSRRGSKLTKNLPIFRDTQTPSPFIDPTIPLDRDTCPEDAEARSGAALPDRIYLDALGFGVGCCCLQITFQAGNVDEARDLYDALLPVTPIMLALTAASPVYRGYLSDVDCRWELISASADDRTEEERGLKPLKENTFVIPKSRYDSVSCYLSRSLNNKPEYNDVPLPFDQRYYDRLRANGVDDVMAKHIAHLFIRDPLVILSDSIDQDDQTSSDHFENIQSTNWQTLRFKPPTANSSIGWRVEFRSMEVQITDFENAAFAIFIVLLSRAILTFGLNFYIPISKVDENMYRAERRGAVTEQKFWFRKRPYGKDISLRPASFSSSPNSAVPPNELLPNGVHGSSNSRRSNSETNSLNHLSLNGSGVDEEYEEMTMNEVMNGKGGEFPGLLGLINTYLDTLEIQSDQRQKIQRYLDLIRKRAKGSLKTTATWIRDYIRAHPSYKFNSVVSQEINYDLITALHEIVGGARQANDLLPEGYSGSGPS